MKKRSIKKFGCDFKYAKGDWFINPELRLRFQAQDFPNYSVLIGEPTHGRGCEIVYTFDIPQEALKRIESAKLIFRPALISNNPPFIPTDEWTFIELYVNDEIIFEKEGFEILDENGNVKIEIKEIEIPKDLLKERIEVKIKVGEQCAILLHEVELLLMLQGNDSRHYPLRFCHHFVNILDDDV